MKRQSLRTKDRCTAQRLLLVNNEAARQPGMNHQIAHGYLRVPEPEMAMRTWQDATDTIIAPKDGDTKPRWTVAMKADAFDPIRKQPLNETGAEAQIQIVRCGWPTSPTL